MRNSTSSVRWWQRRRHGGTERIRNRCIHLVLMRWMYLVIQLKRIRCRHCCFFYRSRTIICSRRRGRTSLLLRRTRGKVWTRCSTRNMLLLSHSSCCLRSFAVCFLQSLRVIFRIVRKIRRCRYTACVIVAANCCGRWLFRFTLRCRGINWHRRSFPLPGKSSQLPFIFVVG